MTEHRNDQALAGLFTWSLGTCFALVAFLPLRHLLAGPAGGLPFAAGMVALSALASLVHLLAVRSGGTRDLTSRSLRVWLAAVALAYLGGGLFTLASAGSLADAFPPLWLLPSPGNLLLACAVGCAVLVDLGLRGLILNRVHLRRLLAATTPATMMEEFSRNQAIVFGAWRDVRSLRNAVVGIMAAGILATLLSQAIEGFPPLAGWLLPALFLSGFVLIGFINSASEEHRFFKLGTVIPTALQHNRIVWSSLSAILAFVLAALVAGTRSFLPVSWVADFIEWLASLFDFRGERERLQSVQRLMQRSGNPLRPLSDGPPPSTQAEGGFNLLPLIIELLGWIAALAFALAVLRFLFKPALESRRDPLAALRAWLAALARHLARSFRSAFAFLAQALRGSGAGFADYRTALERIARRGGTAAAEPAFLRGRSSGAATESLKIYLDCLEWATELGLKLQVADLPRDIAERVGTLCHDALEPADAGSAAARFRAVTEGLEADLFSRTGLDRSGIAAMRADYNLLKMSRRRAASS